MYNRGTPLAVARDFVNFNNWFISFENPVLKVYRKHLKSYTLTD